MTTEGARLDEYSNIERTLVQIFLARRVIYESELNQIHQHLLTLEMVNQNHHDFAMVIDLVQRTFKQIKLEIKKRKDQRTRETVYILVNTEVTDYTKQSTQFTPTEIEHYKMLLEAIFTEDNNTPYNKFYIERDQFINEVSGSKYTIPKFIEDDWIMDIGGNLYPSHRTLAEMEEYLWNEFGPNNLDVLKKCSMCNQLFTMGWQCGGNDCNTRLHEPCVRRYIEGNRHENCINCGVNIEQNHVNVGI